MRRGNSGFSLIEILVVVFIVGMIVMVYAAGTPVIRAASEVGDRDAALHAASERLEYLRGLGYDGLPASGSFSSTQVSTLSHGAGTQTITAYNAQMKQVVVTVSWLAIGSTTRSVSITTLITKTGGLP